PLRPGTQHLRDFGSIPLGERLRRKPRRADHQGPDLLLRYLRTISAEDRENLQSQCSDRRVAQRRLLLAPARDRGPGSAPRPAVSRKPDSGITPELRFPEG